MEDAIVDALRARARNGSAADVARVLDQMLAGGVRSFTFIAYFKRAFPSVPLPSLTEAALWCEGRLSDAGLDALLGEWFPAA